MGVTVSSGLVNPATLGSATVAGDYSLGILNVSYLILEFPPSQQELEFSFLLSGNTIPEETEAFRATISTVEGTPRFQSPTNASLTTTIQIVDDDSKLKILKCTYLIIFISV